MSDVELHPLFNACLNLTSAILLFSGYRAVKHGATSQHKRFMIAAVVVSAVFLVSYLLRYALTGTHAFPGTGVIKFIYLAILFSHMLFAMIVPVGVVIAIRRALKNDIVGHKAIVRWLFPMWAYVSITGIAVYLLLYHFADVFGQS